MMEVLSKLKDRCEKLEPVKVRSCLEFSKARGSVNRRERCSIARVAAFVLGV